MQVRARNREGNSEWSENMEVMTQPAAPETPASVTWQASTSNSIKVSWTPPYSNGSPITSYTLSFKACTGVPMPSPGSSSHLSLFRGAGEQSVVYGVPAHGTVPARDSRESTSSHGDCGAATGTGYGTLSSDTASTACSLDLKESSSSVASTGDSFVPVRESFFRFKLSISRILWSRKGYI